MANFKSLQLLHQEFQAARKNGSICALYMGEIEFSRVCVTAWTTQMMSENVQEKLRDYLKLWYSHSIFNLLVQANKISFYINEADVVNWGEPHTYYTAI